MSTIQLEDGRKLFDLRVHIFDPKTGKLQKTQPYQKVVNGDREYYVRDGIRYTIGGECLDPEKLLGEKPPMVGAPVASTKASAVNDRKVMAPAVTGKQNTAPAVDVESELK